jgi:hypothetical protein
MNDDWRKSWNLPEHEYESFVDSINKNMDLERWGFVQTYSSIDKENLPFIVIYDSQQCRVRFEYYKPDFGGVYHESREVLILYGRLHTKSDSRIVTHKENKVVRNWHDIYHYIIKFLDGMPPGNAMYPIEYYSPMLQELKNLSAIEQHNKIWEYYGKRFFDLFDVRNPELWEKYVIYCNEVQRLMEVARLEYENRKRQLGYEIEKRSNPFVPDEFL